MRRRFEADAAGELAELVAADDEPSGLAIDVTEPGLGRDNAVEPAWLYRAADETAFTSW